MVEQILRETIEKFNRKVAADPNLKRELEGIRKLVQVEVTDGETYNFLVEHGHIAELRKGAVEGPDIRLMASADTLRQLVSGELRPMKALALRKVQVKGSLEDLLRLRKLF